jgi:hypothetical protein
MELDSYVGQVREQLVAAASLGDDRVREVANALAAAALPAVRLAILGALAAAADEITAALLDRPGSPTVAVHLDPGGAGDTGGAGGTDVRIAVTNDAAEESIPPRADEGDASARISLRLSETLKTEIDSAATSAGVSVNTWLVRAASAALGSMSNGPSGGRGASTQHVTGWING